MTNLENLMHGTSWGDYEGKVIDEASVWDGNCNNMNMTNLIIFKIMLKWILCVSRSVGAPTEIQKRQ